MEFVIDFIPFLIALVLVTTTTTTTKMILILMMMMLRSGFLHTVREAKGMTVPRATDSEEVQCFVYHMLLVNFF